MRKGTKVPQQRGGKKKQRRSGRDAQREGVGEAQKREFVGQPIQARRQVSASSFPKRKPTSADAIARTPKKAILEN
jgi:hypothetical protein